MGMFTKLAVAAVVLASMSTVAMAADLVVDVPMVDEVSPSDWSGFYAGLGLTGTAYTPGADILGSIDAIAGVNVVADMFVLGVEGQISGYTSTFGNGIQVSGEVRGGVLASPDVLIYGSLGDTYFVTGGGNYVTAGVGVELKVAEKTTLDLEYKHGWGTNVAFQSNSLSASVLWHF
ncbi:MAG: outer membrane beta-barrel protein [Devosia sp.]